TSPILVVAARVETADAKRACRFKHRCESCGIKVRVDDDEFDVMERDSFAIQPCFYLASSLASDRQLIIRSAGKCRMKAQANRCKAGCGCKRHKFCRLDVDRRKMRDPSGGAKVPDGIVSSRTSIQAIPFSARCLRRFVPVRWMCSRSRSQA